MKMFYEKKQKQKDQEKKRRKKSWKKEKLTSLNFIFNTFSLEILPVDAVWNR